MGSLWFYCFILKNETTHFDNVIANDVHFKYLKYKTKLLGSTASDCNDGKLKNLTIVVPIK